MNASVVLTYTLSHIYICVCACVCVGAEERVPFISLNHIRGMWVQAICNRFQHEARCHLLATLDTDLYQARIPALVPQLVQMVNCPREVKITTKCRVGRQRETYECNKMKSIKMKRGRKLKKKNYNK